jgi:hypothetical protein
MTTCLVAGASLEPGTGHFSHASRMKWNAEYDGAPNDDGITVLDITDPTAVRHCFVVFHDSTALESGRRIRCMMPLLGNEYASLYHGAEELEQCFPVFESLDESPVIDSATLRETWPRGRWSARAPRSYSSQPLQTPATTVEEDKLDTITEALIGVRLEDDQGAPDADIAERPEWPSMLRDYFRRHPQVIVSMCISQMMPVTDLPSGRRVSPLAQTNSSSPSAALTSSTSISILPCWPRTSWTSSAVPRRA